ncbi:MAG: recombinase family protein [Sulfuricurvum sp.]|nr:recombinase family protein [Sulfuricurvum sp.]MDD5386920.1 recombinase family protein [Sulfuricurvum sp.]
MIVSYIRPDKDFENVYEQLKLINAYSDQMKLPIDREMIDQLSQNKRLSERNNVVELFRPLRADTLLIYDTWVLSTNIEDIIQMTSCLLKNGNTIHCVKQGITINAQSDIMVVLGLVDQLRQMVQNDDKKGIGRPRGSKSVSKFDLKLEQIVSLLKQNNSVSEIARQMKVSRSSLKDYVESRELKALVQGVVLSSNGSDTRAIMIETIQCPSIEATKKESE